MEAESVLKINPFSDIIVFGVKWEVYFYSSFYVSILKTAVNMHAYFRPIAFR